LNPREYCSERGAPAGSSFYYAALFHSVPERRALHTCFAFLEVIRRDLTSVTDPTPAVRRLLWWQEELEAGRMAASAHPLVAELRALPVDHAGVSGYLKPGLISGLEELAGWRPESIAHWRSHCHQLHAGTWQLAARACAGKAVTPVTDCIGAIAALAGQLQHVVELAPRISAGHCPLPDTVLQSYDLDAATGAGLLSNPRLVAAINEVVSDLHAQMRQCAGPGSDFLQSLPLFCRVLHLINLALCRQLLRQPERLLTERVALTPLRKLWIAWCQPH